MVLRFENIVDPRACGGSPSLVENPTMHVPVGIKVSINSRYAGGDGGAAAAAGAAAGAAAAAGGDGGGAAGGDGGAAGGDGAAAAGAAAGGAAAGGAAGAGGGGGAAAGGVTRWADGTLSRTVAASAFKPRRFRSFTIASNEACAMRARASSSVMRLLSRCCRTYTSNRTRDISGGESAKSRVVILRNTVG